jgi:ankyrin repeat protein
MSSDVATTDLAASTHAALFLHFLDRISGALEAGEMEAAKKMIQDLILLHLGWCLNTARASNGMTLLTFSAQIGHADVCKLLLDQGADVNQKAEGVERTEDATALIMACFGGHLEVVQLLLNVDGIQVNQSKKNGATPLLITCQEGFVNVVRLLLARKEIQINQADEDGWTPLFVACRKDCVKVVNALLARKEIQINQATNDGRTPLYIACWNEHVKIVNLLLARKEIQINQTRNDGATPLSIACWNDRVKIVNLLLARKEIHINQAMDGGKTPLYMACERGHVKIVSALLAKKEIQINQAKNDGATPLFIACWNDRVKIVNLLLARKEIQINQAKNNGKTPLIIACQYDRVELVIVLLARKEIQINQAMNNGKTALFIACQKGWLRIIELFKRKIDITNRSSTRMYMNQKRLKGPPASQISPIQIACVENRLDIVLFCIFHGVLTPGMPEFWGLVKLKWWYDRLNTGNKNRLLALAEENRRDYNTSYIAFFNVLKQRGKSRKQIQETGAVANPPVARICYCRHPIRLIATFLCGPKEARLVLNQIILFNQSGIW